MQSDSPAQTRAEWLAGELADAILTGELAPGARLDETGLAARYGVSRTPVREALRQLATTGLIDAKPRRGATVTHVTSAQLEELFVAMGEIEATCARLAAMSMTPIERRRLASLHQAMAEIVERGDESAYADANVRFHSTIYKGAHNGIVAEIASSLRRRLAPFRRAQFRAEGRLRLSYAEHDAVVQAIARGDAVQAHTTMLHHVSLVEDAVDQLALAASERRIRG
ncbi:GntR family transcriptional regulator [Chelatococcus reniformis]|uniref:GntR family transcriptional regulator n=1 Tax=Chelatococcus reniformis TaxID=1494448 RepID=A0A916UKL9_9HYPH|nr:GntR family transcriptional regulator [Chelatococcus reniformis]GGC74391.1 GntR family transcriptional regulator [Chelatococcus reniformis]